jgi:ParB/Sulfiredoxin domain
MSGITQYGYERHPLAALFPPLSDERFAELKKDIAEHGQLEPIIINRQHLLIDGWNRLRVCQELGRTPYTVFFDHIHNTEGASEAEYIWSKNMLRRQLTDDQRAAIAVKWSVTLKEDAKTRQKQHGGTAPGKPKDTSGESAQSVPRTRKLLAKQANVSEHKIRQAEEADKQGTEVLAGVIAGNEPLVESLKKAQAKKPKKAPRKINLLSVARETILTAADAVTDLTENKSEYPREKSRSWELFDNAVKRLQDALETFLEKSEASEVTDAEFTDVVERPLSQSHESHAV